MYRIFDTSTVGPAAQEKQRFWRDTVTSVFYQVSCDIGNLSAFDGNIECRELGNIRLIRLKSAQARYARLRQDCDGREPQILVCIPIAGSVELDQLGRHLCCLPGQFLLEYSDAPYNFQYGADADMLVLRIPESMLLSRARSPSRFCALEFDSRSGIGKLFLDYLGVVVRNAQLDSPAAQSLMSVQLVDLLVAVLEADPRVLQSSNSSVRNAHLARIEQHVRKNLEDPELSAGTIATACGISVRYLHLLFADTGTTLAQWIRDHRLQFAHEALGLATSRLSISQVAYAHGFNDHAQFSNAFRKKFGCSPSDVLMQSPAKI